MHDRYRPTQRELQDRFDTRRLADRLAEASNDRISEAHRAFIEARDMFFIATADEDGWPQVSYKGGNPGFVRVIDDHTVVFPVYNGNGMFLTAGDGRQRVGEPSGRSVVHRLRVGHASADERGGVRGHG